MEKRKYCGSLMTSMQNYKDFAEMTESEMLFLSGLIKETKAKKIGTKHSRIKKR